MHTIYNQEERVNFLQNQLDQDYNALTLFRYTIPSICSLLFMSLYQMVDAIFVSNFVSENALAAINIVYPAISVVLAITLMLSTGGSAIVARKLGERKEKDAKEDFTTIILVIFALAVIITVLTIIFLEPILKFLGATSALWEDCRDYLRILILFMPIAALQMGLSTFFITAGKPGFGLALTVVSGATNIILDYVLIVLFPMGISGAAWGTAAGYLVAAFPAVIYFLFQRRGTLFFVSPVLRIKMLGFACFNGSSEMVSNLSVSVTTLLFNKIALHYMGEGGVAAITVILYAQFMLTAIFIGFISGAAPIFSFNLGRGNTKRLAALFRYSIYTVAFMTIFVMICSYTLASPIVSIFIRPDSQIFPLALHGFLLFSISYLFAGFNIYASGIFTALQNGKISAIISGLRTFIFLVLSLLFLPVLFESDGIWLAVPLAEFLSYIIAVTYMIRYRKQYYFTFKF